MRPAECRTGKLCYIEVPAVDVDRSAAFYRQAFGWRLRPRGDGSTSFDNTVNEVSGTFVPGRPPATKPGPLIYIMVADAQAAMDAVTELEARSSSHRTRPHPRYSPGSPIPPATSWASISSPGLAKAEATGNGSPA